MVMGNESLVIGNATKIILHSHGSSFRSLLFCDYDIGMVRMKSPIDFEKKASICLPTRDVASEITCFMPLFNGAEPLPFIIREQTMCNEPKHFNHSLTNRQICADHTLDEPVIPSKGAHLICLSSSSQWFVAGFLSYFNSKFNYSHHPFIFSSAYSMMNFVDSVTGLSLLRSGLEKAYDLIEEATSSVLTFSSFQNDSKTGRTFENTNDALWSNISLRQTSQLFLNSSDLDVSLEDNTTQTFNYSSDLDLDSFIVSNISIFDDLSDVNLSLINNLENETSLISSSFDLINSTITPSMYNLSNFTSNVNEEDDLALTSGLFKDSSFDYNQTLKD